MTSQYFFNVENYEIYHTTHPLKCARGGSAILIRKQMKHNPDTNVSCSEFQSTTVEIEIYGSTLYLTALYSSTRHNIKED